MPIRDSLRRFESGNGYALRMIVQNGMAYSDLTRTLTSSGHLYLPNSTAKVIAFWFGADPVDLSRAIPSSYRVNGQQVTSFLGQRFRRPYHIRFTRPQVCVRCLEEYGIALAVWDLSLVTCCPKHQIMLIDRCLKCQRVLSWRRPDLWTCHCRSEFPLMRTEPASAEAVWLSQQIDDLLFHRPGAVPDRNSASRSVFSAFGLDVLLRVVRALGISKGEQEPDLVPGKLTKVLRTVEAQQVVDRAFSRLEAILGDAKSGHYSKSLHLSELRAVRGEMVPIEEEVLEHVLNMVAIKDAQCTSLKFVSTQQCLF